MLRLHCNNSDPRSLPLPTRALQALHGPRTITLLVQLPGSGSCEVIDSAGPRIGHVKDELIVKYDQLQGIKADQLQLFTLDRIFLDPGLTFIEAGIHTGTTLVVELTTASASTVIHAPGLFWKCARCSDETLPMAGFVTSYLH